MLLISTFVNAQTCATCNPTPSKHDAFIFGGAGWTPNRDLTYSGEVGIWGNTSVTSFSTTFDATHNVSKGADPSFTYWVGIKAYYTVYSTAKISYMVYGKEALQINNSSNSLLEVGFNPNYTLSSHFLLGVTLGNQSLPGSEWNLFSSLGLVYLIKS